MSHIEHEYECLDCGWKGTWDELMSVETKDGREIMLCPNCEGTSYIEDGWRESRDEA